MSTSTSFLRQVFQRPLKSIKGKGDSLRSPYFIVLTLLVVAAMLFAYSNHFTNAFHFDDSHSIVNNSDIEEIDMVRFFTDATTFSSLITNQSYRPLTTLENAIDYHIGGGLDPKPFHIHIFLTFLAACIILFFFVKKVLDNIGYSKYNQFWALLTATIFGLLCVNAETVNYIIQRSEITAAFFVLAGFVAFLQGGFWRKYYVYLLFPFIGFFAKEMAFVFAPLLLLYLLVFEEEVYLLRFYKKDEFKKCLKSLKKALPAFLITIAFYIFYSKMRPETFFPGGPSQFKYLITQPMVMCHYMLTYFVPYNLSADTDWHVFPSLFDYRAIIGIVLVLLVFYVALRATKKKEYQLFSFGMLWFFISLLPTSSFIPFSEVLNDHRTFIPYIGLTIAFVFGTANLMKKFFAEKLANPSAKFLLAGFLVIFIGSNIYGIRQRNKVWNTDLTLWKDVTEKSPNNGRGLMNYGLALMKRGNYPEAEKYFEEALKITPTYTTLHVNLGILKNQFGDKEVAEDYFRKALALNPSNHSSLYYFARFLVRNNRNKEAIDYLEQAVGIAPNYGMASDLLLKTYHKTEAWENLKTYAQQLSIYSLENKTAKYYLEVADQKKSELMLLEENAKLNPSPEKYLDLSLKYYQAEKYAKTIAMAQEALKLKKDYPEAYNNIGIAYFKLDEYDKSIAAYEKALALNPSFQLAKNNLSNAIKARDQNRIFQEKYATLKTADDFLNYSLECYQLKKYRQCIEAAKKSISITASANAYNNMCAAYNQLKEYDKAIEACEKALDLDRDHKLAKGNLDFANARKERP